MSSESKAWSGLLVFSLEKEERVRRAEAGLLEGDDSLVAVVISERVPAATSNLSERFTMDILELESTSFTCVLCLQERRAATQDELVHRNRATGRAGGGNRAAARAVGAVGTCTAADHVDVRCQVVHLVPRARMRSGAEGPREVLLQLTKQTAVPATAAGDGRPGEIQHAAACDHVEGVLNERQAVVGEAEVLERLEIWRNLRLSSSARSGSAPQRGYGSSRGRRGRRRHSQPRGQVFGTSLVAGQLVPRSSQQASWISVR